MEPLGMGTPPLPLGHSGGRRRQNSPRSCQGEREPRGPRPGPHPGAVHGRLPFACLRPGGLSAPGATPGPRGAPAEEMGAQWLEGSCCSGGSPGGEHLTSPSLLGSLGPTVFQPNFSGTGLDKETHGLWLISKFPLVVRSGLSPRGTVVLREGPWHPRAMNPSPSCSHSLGG